MKQQIAFELFGMCFETIPISDNGIRVIPVIILVLLLAFICLLLSLINSFKGYKYESRNEFKKTMIFLFGAFILAIFAFNI